MSSIIKLVLFSLLFFLSSCTDSPKPTAAPEATPTTEVTKPEQPKPAEPKKEAYEPIHHHYICYNNGENPVRKIWIGFSEEGMALEMKNKGRKGTMGLRFVKKEVEEGKAKTIQYYEEIYKNAVNGTYKLTHSGNMDYVEYTRKSDGKVFTYTIDQDANPYGKAPCF